MNATTGQSRARDRTREGRDPSDLERDSDEIRRDMDRTLAALERKFSPREVMERSVDYVREHGSELAHELGDTIRRNPIPILLTATGIAWLTAAIARDRRSNEESDQWASEGDDDDDDEYLDDEYVSDREYASDQDSAVRGRLRSAAERARERARQVGDRLSDTMHARTSEVQHSFGRFVQEQPLVVGMLALTAGALLGAALPVTEYERRAVAGTGNGASRGEQSGTEPEFDDAAQAASVATPPL
jgi:ElaB/YqjD/DUF883 family membrane-anchored ribosome-binding protein